MLVTKSLNKCADDFMHVTIELSFQAKTNPGLKDKGDDIDQCDGITDYAVTLPADNETVELLQKIIDAINDRRLYGFMQQERADACCDGGQWIEKTVQDIADENRG
jgi:hypothetical protein